MKYALQKLHTSGKDITVTKEVVNQALGNFARESAKEHWNS